jgi:hypothetical protein
MALRAVNGDEDALSGRTSRGLLAGRAGIFTLGRVFNGGERSRGVSGRW